MNEKKVVPSHNNALKSHLVRVCGTVGPTGLDMWGKGRATQVDFALIVNVRVAAEIEELSRLRRTRVKGY